MGDPTTSDHPGAVVSRTRFTTVDLDEGIEAIRAQYTDLRAHVLPGAGDFALRLDADAVDAPLGRWSVGRIFLGLDVDAAVDPVPAAVVTIPLGGGVRYRRGRDEIDHGVLLAPSDSGIDVAWSDLHAATVSLDLAGLRRVAAELSGLDPAAVAFTAIAPVSPALGRHVAALTSVVKRTLLDPDDAALSSPLVRDHAFRTLAGGLLAAFPNTTHHDGPRRREDADPATVRRAVEFIDDHAADPIGLGDIAAAAGTSPRALQRAFARHRGVTPVGHLRRVRLEGARAELRTADPGAGDTVAVIAARWGFAHSGRFATEYKQRYGEGPATTLRR